MNPGIITEKDFFDSYNEAVLIVSDKYQLIYANPAFTRLTGFVLDELYETTLPEILKKSRYETAIPFKSYGELAFAKKNAGLLRLRVSESRIRFSDSSMGLIFTFFSFHDLGEPAINENKFYELADASPAMIFIENSEQQANYFNKAWLDFTGKPLHELLGTGWISAVHPDDQKVLASLKPDNEKAKSYATEFRLRKFDDTYRNIYVIGTPVLAGNGAFTGYMSSCLDITEVKETQTKISQLTHELTQANDELEQFTYVTSHDLQEPLRMITAYVQLIQRNIEKGNMEATREFMDFVLSGTSRMQLLITDLLKLSRVNRKAAPFTPVDLQEAINVAMAHLSQKIKATNAKIKRDAMPIILGDTFQLVTLFENILDNALKFTSLDKTPEISISIDEREDKYIFEVKDNGIGIDNKFHKRIFAIFQRLHTRGEYEGTGIGLAVCKKIVERHGGDIWVESVPGEGSSFYFTIKKI